MARDSGLRQWRHRRSPTSSAKLSAYSANRKYSTAIRLFFLRESVRHSDSATDAHEPRQADGCAIRIVQYSPRLERLTPVDCSETRKASEISDELLAAIELHVGRKPCFVARAIANHGEQSHAFVVRSELVS